MKTAVIYARYSSESQTEQSIDGQLRVCNEFAKNNNIVILDTYIDRAMTGTNDNRPDFKRMIKDSSKKQWNYVLVYKLDRFSRNKYETAMHKKALQDNGVKLLSAMENIPETPEGIILESVIEGMNQYYSAELSQKVRRGLNESRLKGNFTGGFLIYGYKVENKKVVIDEEKAEIVKFIYQQYSLGVYVKDIIAKLNEKHITNKGRPFARNTIYGILKNRKYTGVYTYNGETFYNIYPQIIPTEVFEQINKKVDKNKFISHSHKHVYLLHNKIICGYCGSNITADCGTAKDGSIKHYYKCIGRKHNNGCKKEIVRQENLEQLILNVIKEKLQNENIIDTIVKNILRLQNQRIQNNPELEYLEKEKKQTDNALKNLLYAIEQGIISNTTNKRLHELESLQEDLEKKIAFEKSKSPTILSEQEIRNYYIKALSLKPQLLINYMIEQVILFDDRIDIKFNTPIIKSPDDNSRDFCFSSDTFYIPKIKEIEIRLSI